ncbi:lipocalin [Meridianimarinicoccus roseus]|uniref:Outer membrane lipoprotein Blc n=1 Tax=Meridianimarinicoccus roseus TaxID=2072018 RepID=A0A2V2LDB9_9RHOB|nr:lipocalin family protein [Meridianimarinicoccus roseus]PWR01227.1 lipocalin [Meridianimarinicoccus roseus]
MGAGPRLALVLALLAALAGCAGSVYRDRGVAISTQAIDPARYSGLWYEMGRFPVPFQRGCAATTAEYAVTGPGTLSVVNTCREGTPSGPVQQIVGSAEVVGPGKLSVEFDSVPFVSAPYWVLWVDESYTTAVVGVPSGRAGWVLARTPEMSQSRWISALNVLRANGYDTSKLLRTEHGPAR